MTVVVRSSNDILTEMTQKILSETQLTDLAPGSEITKMLEAAANSDYQCEVAALTVLQSSNLDTLVGKDLDSKAIDLLLPDGSGGVGRTPAKKASGMVTISSSFTKISSLVYQGKPAPFIGSTSVFIQDASSFPSSGGQLYIGRGTDHEEGPINYLSIDNTINRPFYTITLDPNTPITKNHVIGESVILAQGKVRVIGAGTTVIAPSINGIPAVQFTTNMSVTLLDGESSISVGVTCTSFGTTGNVQANRISQFTSIPFTGATVTNTSSTSSGQDVESDDVLRQRIKDAPASLSRGTSRSIQSYLRGLSDPVSGRTITSTNIIQPTVLGNASIAYIDDGQGLEPKYAGKSFESLLGSAAGNETLFKTSGSPIIPAIAQGAMSEPFFLSPGMTLVVTLDNSITETFTVNAANYVNITSALATEIVNDFNSQNSRVRFRAASNKSKINVFDLSGNAETMVIGAGVTQQVLGLPVSINRPLFLYSNNKLLNQKGLTASLNTNNFPWPNLNSSMLNNAQFEVDGVVQSFSIQDNDFSNASIVTANITQWVTVLSKKIAGVQVSPIINSDGTSYIQIQTRYSASPNGSLRIISTAWAGNGLMWPVSAANLVSGQSSDYSLNRFSGQIMLTNPPSIGSNITVGSKLTRATFYSKNTATAQYSIGPTNFGNPRLILAADGNFAIRDLSTIPAGATLRVSEPISNSFILRFTANNTQTLSNISIDDFIYLSNDTSSPALNQVPANAVGLYRVRRIGTNTNPSIKTPVNVSGQIINGSNVIVYQSNQPHGLVSGQAINMISTGVTPSQAMPSSSISGPRIVTVLNQTQFSIVASTNATANATSSATFQFSIDTWFEVEASLSQRTSLLGLTINYSMNSFFVFQSQNSTPQIVDFGTGLTVTVEQVISAINNAVVCLTAEKDSPRGFHIRTNNLTSTGSIAVLAVIGSASSIFTTGISGSIQPHVGYSSSGYLWSGSPKLQSIGGYSSVNNYYQTRGFSVIAKGKPVVVTGNPNPLISEDATVTSYPVGSNMMPITGINHGQMTRVYNTTPFSPYSGIARGLNTYKLLEQSSGVAVTNNGRNESIRMEEIPFGVNDKIVAIVDQDSVNQSSEIRLSKNAAISSVTVTSGIGNSMNFNLVDSEDITPAFPNGRPFFNTSSVFNTFDLKDVNVLFHPTMMNYVYPSLAANYNTLPTGNPAAGIVIRSTQWGNAHRIRFAANYANTANSTNVIISHRTVINNTTNPDNGIVGLQLYATLPTGTLVNGSTFTSSTYTITPSNFIWTTTGPAIVQLIIASNGINAGNTYQAGSYLNIGGSTTYAGTYLITASSLNSITVVSPGIVSSNYQPITLDGSLFPVSCFTAKPATVGDIINAISNYQSDNPVATAQFVTSQPSNFSLATPYYYPTFYTQGNTVFNPNLTSISDSIDYHSIQSSYGCILNIYAVNNPNFITGLSQYTDPVMLTATQILNTGYSYLNEPVKLIPASTKSLSNWINLQALTPLSSYANVERTGIDGSIQISSQILGSSGSVQVTGVKGNGLTSALLSNPENRSPYINCRIPFADAESIVTGTLVKVKNSIQSQIQRAYRYMPTGTGVTASNDVTIANSFRSTTNVTYSYQGTGVGRFTFSNTPFCSVTGDTITITKVDAFVAKITTNINPIQARVGDMLYINQTSNANATNECYPVTADTPNQYLGYPVVYVADLREIYVLGSNIINDTFTYSALSHLVFVPVVNNEKNIRTNYNSGAAFRTVYNNSSKLYVKIKTLGNGVMLCSANVATSADLQLSGLSVSSDDYVVFGSAFNINNQGRFRIISHDGAGTFTFYNPKGIDQLFDSTLQVSALDPFSVSYGDLMWGVGLSDSNSTDNDKRHIRIYDADSVFENDYLNINNPVSSNIPWFTSDLIGQWQVTEFGVDVNLNAYVKVNMLNPNVNTQVITLSSSASSVSFSEYSPYIGYKYVVGSAINNQVSTYSDIFLAPHTSFYKMNPSVGTYIEPIFKSGFNTNVNTGIDGYKTYDELMALAVTVVDGSATDVVSYPGVRAAGTAVDIQAPLEKSIRFSVSLQATPGVGLSSIKDPVKSAISNYVKLLGVGQAVVLSEIIKRVQQIPGVLSVVIDSTVPTAINGVISVAPIEVARIVRDSDISI
jgi:hypothetical protein